MPSDPTPGTFLGPLEIEYEDGSHYKITREFDYHVGSAHGDTLIHVPVGFITDFASVPQFLWGLLPPTSWYGKAAVIHDYCYQYGQIGNLGINRKYADDLLYEALGVLMAADLLLHGATRHALHDLLDREAIFAGVRAGGWKAWNHYRSMEAV